MTYLKAITEALEAQRYRFLTGGDRGIAKAIARRPEPAEDDWEWLAKIVAAALKREAEIHREGIEGDQKRENWARELSKRPESELRKRLAQLRSQHAGPEVLESGTRSTSKATRNEGARAAYPEVMAIQDALKRMEAT